MATTFAKIDLNFETASGSKMANKAPNCANCSKKCYPTCYEITEEESTFSYGQTSDAEVVQTKHTCSDACHKTIYRIETDKVMAVQIAKWAQLYSGLHKMVKLMLKTKEPDAMNYLHSIKAIKLFIEYMLEVRSKQQTMAYLLQKKADLKKAISGPLENFHEENTILNMLCKMNGLADNIVKLEHYV